MYVCFGAWVYSNQQTFNNSISPIKSREEDHVYFMPADHSFSDFWNHVNPGSVFVVYILVLIILYCGRLIVGYLGVDKLLSIP